MSDLALVREAQMQFVDDRCDLCAQLGPALRIVGGDSVDLEIVMVLCAACVNEARWRIGRRVSG